MDVSVILATFDRDPVLRQTLLGYSKQSAPLNEFQVIVVDNACLYSTERLVHEISQKGLNIEYLTCAKPGKNASLNMGLPRAKGDLVVLTDDDAIPCSNFISSYQYAAKQYKSIDIFGGAISPTGPSLPKWIDANNSFMQGAFVIRPSLGTDRLVIPTYIWGPNMAIRKNIFNAGFKFNESIGPNGKKYVMGSETEFLSRLEAADYNAMFLEKPKVLHQIRNEQLSFKWLLGRADRQGKGLASHFLSRNNSVDICERKRNFKRIRYEYLKELLKGAITFNKARIVTALYVLRLKQSEFSLIASNGPNN